MEALNRQASYDPQLSLIGVSHKTVGVDVRERLAQAVPAKENFLRSLTETCGFQEAALISTCNRFELLGVGGSSEPVRSFLEDSIEQKLPTDAFYSLSNQGSIKHLFRVASSLDSMVVGEPQIFGQVKESYKLAIEQGTVGRYLHQVFQFAFHIAKKVRANTSIAEAGVSVSYVAVKLAEQIFETLKDKTVLIIGSGRMAELAALNLKAKNCGNIIVANRTLSRASDLALRVDGSAVVLHDLKHHIAKADVVIGSIAAEEPILTKADIHRESAKPLFLIDLGVPRNFSPALNDLDGVYLYNIDDLSEIASANKELRVEAAEDAEIIVDYGVCRFEKWLSKIAAQDNILRIRSLIHDACDKELRAELGDSLKDGAVIDRLTRSISKKISHPISTLLSGSGGDLSQADVLSMIIEDFLEV